MLSFNSKYVLVYFIFHVIPVVCTKTSSQINSENQKYNIALTLVGIGIDIDIDCVEKINIICSFGRTWTMYCMDSFSLHWPNVETYPNV